MFGDSKALANPESILLHMGKNEKIGKRRRDFRFTGQNRFWPIAREVVATCAPDRDTSSISEVLCDQFGYTYTFPRQVVRHFAS